MNQQQKTVDCIICQESILDDPSSFSDEPEPVQKKSKSSNKSLACCPPCGHIIHTECLEAWFGSQDKRKKEDEEEAQNMQNLKNVRMKGTCPTCRSKVSISKLYPVHFSKGEKPELPESENSSTNQEKDEKDEAINDLKERFEEWASEGNPENRRMFADILITGMLQFQENFSEESESKTKDEEMEIANDSGKVAVDHTNHGEDGGGDTGDDGLSRVGGNNETSRMAAPSRGGSNSWMALPSLRRVSTPIDNNNNKNNNPCRIM